MITLLSPSKKLNFKHQDAVSAFTQCDFIESAQELINQAKNLTSQDLKDLMKISDSLADLNKERFNNWSLPFNQDNAKQAILAFDGGYTKSRTAIIDANITTLLAAIILFFMGSGPVKGFAVTLGVGIFTTLFSVYFIARLFTSLYVTRNKNKEKLI